MPEEWITQREVAAILGVHKSAIPKMQRRGDLTPRARRRPALSLAAVVELKAAREAAALELERRHTALVSLPHASLQSRRTTTTNGCLLSKRR
ncbi:hypothetical protein [Nocardioides exalbidus]|uniref:hypothetical protein n=1 Tax=Nocardioides exalbidus TaxID=402596 RepID=UPI0011153972|nr:hypothetical protein [Nocardioides exalbidus]